MADDHESKPEPAVELWQRRLEHLQISEAKNADPLRAFELQEQIKEAEDKIAELSSKGSTADADDVAQSDNQLAGDLNASISRGKLHDSRLAELVLECCREEAPLVVADDYDFTSLESVIRHAEELTVIADKLAGKREGREAAISAISRVVFGLAMAVSPSRGHYKLVISATERCLDLPVMALSIRWPKGGKNEFYNTVVWGDVTNVEELLENFCDDKQ